MIDSFDLVSSGPKPDADTINPNGENGFVASPDLIVTEGGQTIDSYQISIVKNGLADSFITVNDQDQDNDIDVDDVKLLINTTIYFLTLNKCTGDHCLYISY